MHPVLTLGGVLAAVTPCAGAQTPASPAAPITASFDREVQSLRTPTIIRWAAGAPHSREFLLQGHRVKVILSESVAVVAYLESVDDPLRIQMWFFNETGQPFNVIPENFALAVLEPAPKSLPYVSPKQVTKRIESEATWAAVAEAVASVGRAFGDTSATSTSGTMSVTDSRGRTTYGTYNGLSATYDSGESQRQTASNLSAIAASAEDQKLRLLTGVLLPNTVFDGQDFGGVVHFKRDKRATVMLLRVPVADSVFEFPIEMPKK